jgi:hypothetical protein
MSARMSRAMSILTSQKAAYVKSPYLIGDASTDGEMKIE